MPQGKNIAAKLILANKELAYQNSEKEKRAAELLIANEELAFQNQEKEKRAGELLIANQELAVAELEPRQPHTNMTLVEAMDYVSDYYESLIDPVSEKHVLGLIATPDDPDTDFCIFELSCTLAHDRTDSPHNVDEDGGISDYYHIHLQGGVFFKPASVSVFHGGSDAETLLASMPPQLADVRFTVYTLADGHQTHTTEQALFKIFPSLPDPDKLKGKIALYNFKHAATALIDKSNLG